MLEERWQLEPGFSVELFAKQDTIKAEEIVSLWERENVLPPREAQRRISEVLFVGTDPEGDLVGVSSAYLQYTPQLQLTLWYYRAFVANSRRHSKMAITLALSGREYLKERFISGEDLRGVGQLFEVENEGLKRYFNEAVWYPADVVYIGDNERGDHVRVHYFPGSLAPEPPHRMGAES